MTNRERALAVLNYTPYDRLPIVHFGFWQETLMKWAREGHITEEQAQNWSDGTPIDKQIGDLLGFDFGWYNCFTPNSDLLPTFEPKVLKIHPDGSREILSSIGVIELDQRQ